MNPNIFLFSLAFIWMIFAVIQDIRKREIANWLNFSLIIFALGFRAFYSLFVEDVSFILQGLFGLAIFFILGNLFYKIKLFAGGDAKLLIALGAVLPIYSEFWNNLKFLSSFLLIFLIIGSIYGLVVSVIIGLKNRKKLGREFAKQFKNNKKIIRISLIFAILFSLLAFFEYYLIFLAILVLITPYLYIYAKAVDESCMIKQINPKMLTEGDWLYKDVKIGSRTIMAKWDGLTKSEISRIRKSNKRVTIRQGIPFSPAFLISLIAIIWVLKNKPELLF